MPTELSTDQLPEPVASCDTVVECLARLSSTNGVDSAAANQVSSELDGQTMPLSRVVELAAAFGFSAQWTELDWAGLKATGFTNPILVLRNDNDAVIVTAGGRAGAEEVSVWDPHHDGVVFFVPREDFERHWNGHALIMTPFRVCAGDAVSGAADAMETAQPAAEAVANTYPSSCVAASRGPFRGLTVFLVAVVLAALCGLGAYHVLVDREVPSPIGAATNASPHSTRDPVSGAEPPGVNDRP
jgi:hypothetical protein